MPKQTNLPTSTNNSYPNSYLEKFKIVPDKIWSKNNALEKSRKMNLMVARWLKSNGLLGEKELSMSSKFTFI